MKSVFDKTTREGLITRINTLDENSTAQWGKMTVYQMLKHCRLWEQMVFGQQKYKRGFLGLLFGKMALKDLTKDDEPLKRNTPTIAELKITGTGDVASEKKNWLVLIEQYAHFSNTDLVHPFFGKMTKEQIGYLAYKHTDHHLRQFNC
jgi:Protein of unknown function (DUF1569)